MNEEENKIVETRGRKAGVKTGPWKDKTEKSQRMPISAPPQYHKWLNELVEDGRHGAKPSWVVQALIEHAYVEMVNDSGSKNAASQPINAKEIAEEYIRGRTVKMIMGNGEATAMPFNLVIDGLNDDGTVNIKMVSVVNAPSEVDT